MEEDNKKNHRPHQLARLHGLNSYIQSDGEIQNNREMGGTLNNTNGLPEGKIINEPQVTLTSKPKTYLEKLGFFSVRMKEFESFCDDFIRYGGKLSFLDQNITKRIIYNYFLKVQLRIS
jgi:hypothetical protein